MTPPCVLTADAGGEHLGNSQVEGAGPFRASALETDEEGDQ